MKVSIIIPVYNKEQYLRPCLTSALSQDFEDYEVIAVDDGSTDASGHICDEMASKDSRLRVIHTENGGVTAARRRGVEEAKGEHIMFSDSDDQLLPHALHNSYEAIMANDADEVIAPYQNQRGDIFDTGHRGFIKSEEIIQDFLAGRNSFPSNCAILFKRSLLDGCLNFTREITIREDILFHIRVLIKSPRVFCIAASNYVYNQGIPNTRSFSIEQEILYEKNLFESLQSRWKEFEYWFQLYQLKTYEIHLNEKEFDFCKKHYKHLKGHLNHKLPPLDRLVLVLPPRLAWLPVHLYKKWLRSKSKQITSF